MSTILSSLSDSAKEYLINELKDFYIQHRESLGLPSYATFGGEIEFNILGYDNAYKQTLKKEVKK